MCTFFKKNYIYFFIFICLLFIFANSSMTASLSEKWSSLFYQTFNHIFVNKLSLSHQFIRKAAHFSEYFILGTIVFFFIKNRKHSMFVFIVPFLDEFYQAFVPGRCALLSDVFIDTCGLITGMGLVFLIKHLLNFQKNTKNTKKE